MQEIENWYMLEMSLIPIDKRLLVDKLHEKLMKPKGGISFTYQALDDYYQKKKFVKSVSAQYAAALYSDGSIHVIDSSAFLSVYDYVLKSLNNTSSDTTRKMGFWIGGMASLKALIQRQYESDLFMA